jgi:hypothetical protein
MKRQDQYERQLLTQIEGGHHVSQRSLSTSLGIALGLTNLLVRRVVKKGWVRAIRIKPNRMSYLLTPAGIAEKARMSTAYFHYSLQYYGEVRDRVREQLAAISRDWPAGAAAKRIVFFGDGEVAEIAYICLQETDLTLVAVVVDSLPHRFFGVPVHLAADLRDGMVGDTPFDRVIVASFEDRDRNREQLAVLGVAPDRIRWL